MEQHYEDEIDLLELFSALLKKWKYIVFSALFVGGITALVNQFVLIPQYASTSKFYVLSKSTSLTSLADVQLGTSLTQDYMIIVKGRGVVDEVIKELDLDLTYEQLLGKVTVENPADSRIITITVKDADPKQAKKIADKFADVAVTFIGEKMDQQEPNVFEYGYVNNQHVSPSKTKNTMIGTLAGGVLAAAVVILLHLMDDSIKTPDDIERYLGLNTLASLPDQDESDQKEKKRKRRKRRRKGGTKKWKKSSLKK